MDAKKKLDCSKSRKLEVIPSLSLTVNYWLLALMWQKHFLYQSLDHPFTKFLNLPLFSKLFYKLVLTSFFYTLSLLNRWKKKKLNKFGSSDKYRTKREKHVGSNSVHIWFVEQVMLVFFLVSIPAVFWDVTQRFPREDGFVTCQKTVAGLIAGCRFLPRLLSFT